MPKPPAIPTPRPGRKRERPLRRAGVSALLPPQLRVLERGWLSSNNILFLEGERASLVDSGYVSHADQTVALLRQALEGRSLARLVNTHSHSDHIGGNAALARAFGCRIAVPEGIAPAVANWDEHALLLTPSGQRAEAFAHDEEIAAGDTLELGALAWRAVAVPGHDNHALAFHNAEQRILISGDALWRDGFGVIFPELVGEDGFGATRRTLETLARLPVDVVIPGHGAPFADVGEALKRAFQRLDAFEQDSARLGRHALKVLFTFMLLERQRLPRADLCRYLEDTPLCRAINRRTLHRPVDALADWLVRDLERAGVLETRGDEVVARGS